MPYSEPELSRFGELTLAYVIQSVCAKREEKRRETIRLDGC